MISTSAGRTPRTPPSRTPLPPHTFSNYFARSARQAARARRHERHAVLVRLDLLRDSDDHDSPLDCGPSETTVWRSGAKNSAAALAMSSAVSAATVASMSSRLRYGSPLTDVL